MLWGTLKNKRIQYIVFSVFIISVICGSVYCMMLKNNEFSSVNEYFSAYVRHDINKQAIIKKSFINNIIFGAVVLVCGFFRAGVVIAPVMLCKEGFNIGFCIAGLCRCFGFSGAVIGGASQVHLLLLIPLLVIFVSFSVEMACNFRKIQKNLKFFFVFFQLFLITIFCGFSFFLGYINTTFMKFIIVKLIK